MTLPAKLAALLHEIEACSDYDEKCELLIEFAESFKPVEQGKYEQPYDLKHQVPGCESEVYLWVNKTGNYYQFDVAVENPQGISAMALAQILIEGLQEATKEEILTIPDQIVYQVFGDSLSMGKGQGLMGMLRLLKQLVGKIK